MTQIDVVIATYNSEKRIGKTFESLCELDFPKDQWRLLIINNNSTDNTRHIAEAYNNRLPITIIDAPVPGKSAALNSAIPHFAADLIVFTDDDVRLAPDWLTNMKAEADVHPDYAIFAGKIVGEWEIEPDAKLRSWIPIGSTYATHEREESGPCEPGIVWGPNMAIRKTVFDAGHQFNVKVGPQPAKFYPMGQDTEMARRLNDAGFQCYYTTKPIVYHAIKKATINEDWVIRRAERLGYGIFIVHPRENFKQKLPSLPLWLELLLLRLLWSCVYPATFLLPRIKHRFWSRWKYFFYRGLHKGFYAFVAQSQSNQEKKAIR